MTIKTKVKALAYYQIAGGVIGWGMVLWFLLFAFTNSFGIIYVIILSIALFTFSFYCGQQLLSGNIQKALRLSLINQALQAISFTLLGFAFSYITGICIFFGIDLTDGFNLVFSLSTSIFELKINSHPEMVIVKANIIAFYLIYFIGKLQKGVKRGSLEVNRTENTMLDSELITENQETI